MLPAMFGMGGSEILVILIVALLFLGPDKLPEAAKQISKGIRDIKRQSRVLQQTIEDDENIGGAIRDLKSALRGEDLPVRPKPIKAIPAVAAAELAVDPVSEPVSGLAPGAAEPSAPALPDPSVAVDSAMVPVEHNVLGVPSSSAEVAPASSPAEVEAGAADRPTLTLPPTAGETDADQPSRFSGLRGSDEEHAALAALVRPAPNTIARGATRPSAAAAPADPPGTAAPIAASPASAEPAAATGSAEAGATGAAVPPGSDKSEPTHG
jgi:sec-independent protein translocase protein TatB